MSDRAEIRQRDMLSLEVHVAAMKKAILDAMPERWGSDLTARVLTEVADWMRHVANDIHAMRGDEDDA